MLFLAACAICLSAVAQEESSVDFDKNILLPFPSSTAFKQYATPQPSLSTGTVNVPIELYRLKYRELEIPFTLQYSTQGVKVYDDSYPNGLGWTLTPGMRITRTIMGLPDELFPHHQYNENTDRDNFDTLYPASVPYDRAHSQKVTEYGDTLIDMQHDIFTVYLPGESQTFVIERDSNGFSFVGNECNNLKITADRQLSNFFVVDGKGVTYNFSKEASEYRGQRDNVTAWMLKEVTLPCGSKVDFNWAAYNHHMPSEFGNGTLVDDVQGGLNGSPNFAEFDLREGYNNPTRTGSIPSHSSSDDMMHLIGVSFPTGSISLEYETTGGGVTPVNQGANPLLKAFTALNSAGDTVRSASMCYDRMNRSQALLESVSLSGEGTYTFDYQKVPIDYSQRYAQDWWGYYNGKTDNVDRVPRITVTTRVNRLSNLENLQVGEADRSVDTVLMQANMLTAVHFPTGGFCRFEYEPHRWNMNALKKGGKFHYSANDDIFGDVMAGGGLRIKRISLYESVGAEPAVTEYRYGDGENGLAECTDMPLPHTFLNERTIYIIYFVEGDANVGSYREVTVNPESDYMRYHINESPLWYSHVTEYKSGGKTVYTFKKYNAGNDIMTDFGGGVLGHMRMTSSKGVLLVQKDEFQFTDGNYKQLSSVKYDYNTVMGQQFLDCSTRLKQGIYTSSGLSPLLMQMISGEKQTTNNFGGISIVEALPYTLEFYTEQLKSVSTVEYTVNGTLETTQNYQYCRGLDLVSEVITSRNGETLSTVRYNYPSCPPAGTDGSQLSLMQSLVDQNRIADPCKTVVSRDGAATAWTTLFGFDKEAGMVLPQSRLFSRNGKNRNLYTLAYDSRGNITSTSGPGGLAHKAYLWGYGNEYPVVAASGMTRSQVENVLGKGAVDAIETCTKASALSVAHDALSAAGGLVETFEVRPLIGITSYTAQNRNRSRFNYDRKGRLSAVLDLNGDIVSRYAYSSATEGAGQDAFLSAAWTASAPNHTSSRTMLDSGERAWLDQISYYDGLGRERESVILGNSYLPNLATLIEYDAWGRPCRKWNATPVQEEGLVPASSFAQVAGAFYCDEAPFVEYRRLMSPSDSVVEIKSQGANWAGRSGVLLSTYVNDGTAGLRCARFTVGSGGALQGNGYVAKGMLRVDMRTDEDGGRTLRFTDGRGLTVLSRAVGLDGTTADTYFVYDSYDKLRYVIPPMAAVQLAGENGTWTISDDVISRYAYCYSYDDFGRCISKTLPGCEPVYMHYDCGDRLVLVQDGNMRKSRLWEVNLFDKFGRPAVSLTAKLADPVAFADNLGNAEQDASAADLAGYRVDLPLPAGSRLLSVSYYDNYGFIGMLPSGMQETFRWKPADGYSLSGECAAGLLTGKRVFILGDTVSTLSVVYYDAKGRKVQTVAANHMGGFERESFSLSFTGKPLKSMAEHSAGNQSDVVCSSYSYDSRDRLVETRVSYDGGAFSPLTRIEYDGAGRVSCCVSGPGVVNKTIDYNARGWTTGVNCGQLFTQRLSYEKPQGGALPRYGGDVSQMAWTQRAQPDSSGSLTQQYNFAYDGLGRLSSASYSGPGERSYGTAYSYDLNCNVTSILRQGLSGIVSTSDGAAMSWGKIDNVTLSYDGNQLKKADDAAGPLSYAGAMDFKDKADRPTEYEYDACGNMTRDLNKGIAGIDYNELNLPSEVRFADGHVTRYTYDAAGRKLRVEYLLNSLAALDPVIGPPGTISRVQRSGSVLQTDGTEKLNIPTYVTLSKRDYCGSHVYLNDSLERIVTPAGYRTGGRDYYYLTDYQSNVRLVVDQDGRVVESNHYYPYGMLMGPAPVEPVQPCKYTGKELDRQAGLDFYDFEARHMDPALGRTTTQDPMAEKYSGLSPYLWCAGNPVKFVDSNGMYLKGLDGRPVFFDKEKGWSSNATTSITEIGDAMMKTKQGMKILSKMMKSAYPITLLIDRISSSNKAGEIVAGETYANYILDNKEKPTDFKDVVIIIYEKVINEYMSNDALYKNSGLSTSDIIGTVATHEGKHGTDKKANSGFVSAEEAENKALNIEKKAINELKKRNNQTTK